MFSRPSAPWARYTLALAIFAVALAARVAILPAEAGLGFLTFYPATAFAALLCGTGPGLLVVALGGVAAHYAFMPPYWAFKWPIPFDQAISEAPYLLSGVIICLIVHRMRTHAEAVREANRHLEHAMEELTRREVELAGANERLEDLDRAKTEFFSNVSHEFRTPLALMVGPLEELLAKPEDEVPPAIRDGLAVTHRNGLRLLKLVNGLLDFSRIEAGRSRALFAPTDLAAVTADLASNFHAACERAGLALVVDCLPLPEPVYVDHDMWEKVVLNLLSNAFKFTFAGTIAVRVAAGEGHAEVVVADSGTGIPAAELPRIFERFHRIEGAKGRSHEGSGIGLALVHELVALHGGTIAVDSVEGRGTTFTIRLPFGTAHLPYHPRAADAPSAADMTATRASAFVEEALRWLPDAARPQDGGPVLAAVRGRIVVADDNQDMRAYVCRLLETAGYRVDAVADGQAALAACRDNPPDLMLSDVMMPELDGFGLLAKLRTEERTHLLPVILLSARAGEEARIEGIAAGADDYLVKPFGARELVARIEGAIRLSRTRADAARRERDVIVDANAKLADEIEERTRVAAQLATTLEELQRSNQELDEFAYIASHDLKEPLRGIHNYVSFLKEDYGERLDDDGRGYLDRMQRLTERLAALIDRLLAYSRLGSEHLCMDAVDTEAVLGEVVEDLKPALAAQGVELRRVGPLPTVTGNSLRIGEVFQNLIANAAKYNDKAEKWVEVGCESTGAVPVFHVRDNGIGIPEQHRDTVFRIFKRLHEQSKFGGGTGAGLTIVKKIVERHGGRIWVESTPGEGTTFRFTLGGEH
ncbi:MAG: response regulator [Magnetospirillum sp.]|nr:response regulator [Magnetospirillum sp.]